MKQSNTAIAVKCAKSCNGDECAALSGSEIGCPKSKSGGASQPLTNCERTALRNGLREIAGILATGGKA